MKRVAEVLGVSRSQLHARLSGAAKVRSSYRLIDDAELLPPLRTLVDERQTYGYRRITALMNRERLKNSLPRLNHKRIYRLMSQNRMLLQRYTGKPPTRAHEGTIITIRSNLRWTSDGLEISCWKRRASPSIILSSFSPSVSCPGRAPEVGAGAPRDATGGLEKLPGE